MAKKSTPYFVGHKKYGQMGPMTEKEYYESMPMKNIMIKKFMPAPVKDVEKYNPITKKSKMIYKPGKP